MAVCVTAVVSVQLQGEQDPKDRPKATDVASPVDRITSSDAAARVVAAQELREKRTSLIKCLLVIAEKQIKAGELHSSKELAIELLGEFRAEEAVPLLVSEIEFEAPVKILGDLDVAAAYPAARALAKVGIPAVEEIVRRLEGPASEKRMKLFATVFRLVDGDDIAVLRAELALKKAEGQQQKKNIEQLIELLKAKQWYF